MKRYRFSGVHLPDQGP